MAAGGQNGDFKGFIWAKYEETENFETVAGFSIFTETGSKALNTRITALFDDKAIFIDTSKTPIIEWEVAILFIHL